MPTNSSALPDVFVQHNVVDVPTDAFCTTDDLTMIFGPDFLREYTADLQLRGITNGVALAITEAHETILSYLLTRHTEEELRQSNWVKLKEARVAGYYLALRRGQSVPEGIQQSYIQALEEIEEIVKGSQRRVPGVPARHLPGPTISNFEVDNRFLGNRQRRQLRQSSSTHQDANNSRDEHYL